MANYYISGYTPPGSITSKEGVRALQASLGVKADGIWGPKSQAAYDAAGADDPHYRPSSGTGGVGSTAARNPSSYTGTPVSGTAGSASDYTPPAAFGTEASIRYFQQQHGLAADGIWGKKTQAAYEKQTSDRRESAKATRTGYSALSLGAGSGGSGSARLGALPLVANMGLAAAGVGNPSLYTAVNSAVEGAWSKKPSALQSARDIKRVQAGLSLQQTGIWDDVTNAVYWSSRSSHNYTPVKNVYNAGKGIDVTATVAAKINGSRLTDSEKARALIVLEELEEDGRQWLDEQIDKVGIATIFSQDSIEERLRNAFVEDTGFATEVPRSAKETQRLTGLLREQLMVVRAELAALPERERIGVRGKDKSKRVYELMSEAAALTKALTQLAEEGYQHGGLDEKTITIRDPHAPGGTDQIPFLGASSDLRLQTLLEDHDLLGGQNEGRDHKDIYWERFEPGMMGLAAQEGQAHLHALPYYAPFEEAERAYYDFVGALSGTAQSLALGQIATNEHNKAQVRENAAWERMNRAEIDAGYAEYAAGVNASRQKLLWDSWDNYEKVMQDGQLYAKVGDRLYSRHAVDRMQPSGKRYTVGDAIKQASGVNGRSVAPQFVEEIIGSAIPSYQSATGNYIYILGTVKVILNPQGAVVTVITY